MKRYVSSMPAKIRMTTIAVDSEVLLLIEAIVKKRSAELDLKLSKAAVVRNIIVHEARSMGLYPPKVKK
jgi:hypothetical protein